MATISKINDEDIAIMSVLSEGMRLNILRLISENGELCAKEIKEYFTITQPTLSHHMAILFENDIVSVRKEGRNMYYSINTRTINRLRDMLLELTTPPIKITNSQILEENRARTKRTVMSNKITTQMKKKSSVPKPKNSLEAVDIDEIKKKKKKKVKKDTKKKKKK